MNLAGLFIVKYILIDMIKFVHKKLFIAIACVVFKSGAGS